MDNLVGNIILGWARHVIGGFAGGLVVQGYLTQDQSNQAVGAIMVLIPLALSAYDKVQARSKAAALAQAMQSSTLAGGK